MGETRLSSLVRLAMGDLRGEKALLPESFFNIMGDSAQDPVLPCSSVPLG